MIEVKVFGQIRYKSKVKRVEVEAATVKLVLIEVAKQLKDVDLKEIEQCMIFVNGTPIDKLNMFKTQVVDGDVVSLLSPCSGG